jgi:Fe-S oxidoreductase/uncharacterized protein GlcG (DUF336 family)
MLSLGREIAMFQPIIGIAVRGDPDAVLIVEFAEEDQAENIRRLKQLGELMADLGFGWDHPQRKWGGVVEITEPALQTGIAEFRAAGLNVMMSMKQEGKPVSFVEDCAVPLPHLADYTERLNAIFAKHGTRGTMYAHASEGCLHVRPVLNLKLEKDVKAMRAIAEETFAMVREYKGSHSGEHGDGIVRSEFHETMFGSRIVADFREVKHRFDPDNLLNPGKIVDPPNMDDRSLFRYPPDYRIGELKTALDWSAWPGAGGGFQGAVEMCNNNGACRKLEGGVMCPSYRATRDEKDVTRGRANTLRLAISGQLGPDALASDEMMDTLKLCVSCKACRHECPTGVDMAKMKIEVLTARVARHGLSLRDRLVGFLPHYAGLASRLAPLANLRNRSPLLRKLFEKITGISAQRALPEWRRDVFIADSEVAGPSGGREVVLFADTFNRAYERENLDAALRVLVEGGYRVHIPKPADGSRPLCCGRTFLSAGLVDHARTELDRLVATYAPFAARGVPIVGLEPSCLLTLRDELLSLRSDDTAKSISAHALLFEEFLVREAEAGRLQLPLGPVAGKALVHGHCHQKSFGAFKPVEQALRLVPDLKVETVESSCCGMAGAFGYGADTYQASMQMAELSLLPAVRGADTKTLIVADGTSCRHQIKDGAERNALHVARVLAMSLDSARSNPTASPSQRKETMAELTLDVARKILDAALAKGVEKKLKPLVVTVLDARGCTKITAAQDGTSLMRAEIAHGKAYGALAMGMGSRALFQRSQEQPSFIGAMNGLAQGALVPVPGGVLIQDGAVLLGAVGISGDTSDNDEICAIAGIEAAGLKANPG